MLLVPVKVDGSSIHGLGIFASQAIRVNTRIWSFTPGFVSRNCARGVYYAIKPRLMTGCENSLWPMGLPTIDYGHRIGDKGSGIRENSSSGSGYSLPGHTTTSKQRIGTSPLRGSVVMFAY